MYKLHRYHNAFPRTVYAYYQLSAHLGVVLGKGILETREGKGTEGGGEGT